MHIHRAPDGNLTQVLDLGAIGITYHEVDHHRPILIIDHADRHTIRGGHQGVTHVTPLNTRTQCILPYVISHKGLTLRLPVVLHRIGIHVRTTTHHLLGLTGQVTQDRWIGTGKLGLHRVGCRDREVVFTDANVGIGIAGTQGVTDGRDLLHHRLIVFAIHHQLTIAVTSCRHRTHQAIVCRRATHAGRYPGHLRILLQPVAHLQQVMLHPVRAGLRGQPIFHDKLAVIKIGEEEVLHLRHAKEAGEKHHKSQSDRSLLIANQKGDTSSHEPMHRGVHQLSLRGSLLIDDRILSEHLLGAHRHLHQG